MIEDSILKYLRASTSLVTALGSADSIVIGTVPPAGKMPWLSVEVAPGTREKISQVLVEQKNPLRIIVSAAPHQANKGRQCIELALRLLENYRGSIYSVNDAHITCGSISGLGGLASVVRYQFTASVRYTEAYQEPV